MADLCQDTASTNTEQSANLQAQIDESRRRGSYDKYKNKGRLHRRMERDSRVDAIAPRDKGTTNTLHYPQATEDSEHSVQKRTLSTLENNIDCEGNN